MAQIEESGTEVVVTNDADKVVLSVDMSTGKLKIGGVTPPVANADTSGAALGALETEVNELKAMLRLAGLLG
jgi:hypothetical protein